MDQDVFASIESLRRNISEFVATCNQSISAIKSETEKIKLQQQKTEQALHLAIDRLMEIERRSFASGQDNLRAELNEIKLSIEDIKREKEVYDRRIFYMQSDIEHLKRKQNMPDEMI
ncbi:MAG: hypothetical protein QXK37_06030 [Candidatus Woesearchaeota archaeon]